MSSKQLRSVVLDEAATQVLLTLAASEGLLEEKRERTDAFLEMLLKKHANSPIYTQVLEQIVLTPNILTFAHLPEEGLHGLLLDRGMIRQVPKPAEPTVKVDKFSKPVIGGMLAARGYSIPESEFEPRLRAAQLALAEAEQYELERHRETPNLFRRKIQEMLSNVRGTEIVDEYTEEEYTAEEGRQQAYNAAMPILDCMLEYLNLATVASQENALLKTPTYPTINQTIPAPDLLQHSQGDEIALFRIVATGLGKLTYRPTLKESLKLAEEPATQALRDQLPEWIDELSKGNLATVEKVQREIQQATSALERLSPVKSTGTLTTWLAVPVSLTELFLGLPPVLGITVSLIGKGASAATVLVEKKYKWAMFGNT